MNILSIDPSGTVGPCGTPLVFPHAVFNTEEYSAKEQAAINFHLALIFKLLRLFEDPAYYAIFRPLSRLAFSLYCKTLTAINFDHANVQPANDELVSLVPQLEELDKTLSPNSIQDAYSKYATHWDSTADDTIEHELLTAMQTLGIANILASPTIIRCMKEAFLRRYHSQPNPALSTIFKKALPVSAEQEVKSSSKIVLNDPPVDPSLLPDNSSKKPRTDNTSPSSGGFQVPRKYAKPVTSTATTTPVTNSFQPLLLMDTSNSAPLPPDVPVKSANPKNSEKPQPIFIKHVPEYREIINQILTLSSEPLLKKAVDDTIRLTPASIPHYRAIQKYLSENNIQFYAMLPKSERPKKIVIRGLPTDTLIDDIKTELCNLGLAVHRISQMKNFKTKVAYPNFIVDLFKNEALPGVFQIGNILGYQVSISNYTSTHPKQCYNCQRWGHSSDICSFSSICLKCSGPHLSRTCSVPREKICCANCNQNHCSNYSLCPKNPKFIKNSKMAAEKEAAILKISSFPAHLSSVRLGTNFAAAASARRSNQTRPPHLVPRTHLQTNPSAAPPPSTM